LLRDAQMRHGAMGDEWPDTAGSHDYGHGSLKNLHFRKMAAKEKAPYAGPFAIDR
jgi:hypothetical protein